MSQYTTEVPLAAYALVPFAAGMLAGGLHVDGGAGALVAAALLAWCARRSRVTSPALRVGAAAVAAGIAAGACAAAIAHLPPAAADVVRAADGTLVAIEGVVVRSEDTDERTAVVVAVDHVRSGRRSGTVHGLVAITIAHAARAWPTGTRLRVVGKLRRARNFANPGAYDHAGTLARRGIRATLFLWDDRAVVSLRTERSRLAGLRTRLAATIERAGSEPARGYLQAVLLGASQSLDPDVRAALTATGLAHVVSVSGFHVAVAAGACVLVLRHVLRRMPWIVLRLDVTKLAAGLGLVPVGAYAALAGDSVPAARSFLTYGVLVAALLFDRPPDALRALAAAAVLLAVATPDVAADVSFQLSFVSVLALLLLARRARAGGTPAAWWRRWIVAPMEVSVAATVATAPLTAWHFQQTSLIAPLANLVALPWLGPATLLPGLVALPLVVLAPALAEALLAIAARAATIGLAIASRLAAWPWAAVATPMPTGLEVGLAYAVLALWWTRRHRLGGWRPGVVALVVVLGLGDVAYWTWERCLDPSLRVTFLSVGQGDAAVVELPNRGVLVVDGGGFPSDFDPGARLIAPFLRSRKIMRVDALVLSHPQLDHYGGLAHLATAFAPRELWWNGTRGRGARFAALEAALRTAGTRPVTLRRGTKIALAPDLVAEVLHPDGRGGESLNDGSLVLRLRFGAHAVLFTGDVEHGAERAMLTAGGPLRSDVLKVPHHGSATSTTAAWLAAVAPRDAVISSGAGNRFGFPAAAVVARLHAAGARVWNTAEHGAVRVVVDERGVSVAATRASAPERFEFPQLLW